ncbi:MAG: NIL domain-containing protein [Caldicoprobacterales bacterium]|jgi:ferredoxin|nr:4Fe-4S binding protein [Clostridiales bacterium]
MKKIKLILYFPPEKTDKPFTYHLVKDYDVIFNILQAEVQPGKRGRLTIELEGTEENIQRALAFTRDYGIEYRPFNKNIVRNQGECVDCGVCTSVCPSGALYMDTDTWKLNFDEQKCLVCELCIRACPVKAIDVNMFD